MFYHGHPDYDYRTHPLRKYNIETANIREQKRQTQTREDDNEIRVALRVGSATRFLHEENE